MKNNNGNSPIFKIIMGILISLKTLAIETTSGDCFIILRLIDGFIKAIKNIPEFGGVLEELVKAREVFEKQDRILAKHGERLAVHGERLAVHDSEISNLKTIVDSLYSEVSLSKTITPEEFTRKLEEMESRLKIDIAKKQEKAMLFPHSADVKTASAIVMYFEHLLTDDNQEQDVKNLLEDVKLGAASESIEEIIVDNLSIIINFDEYLKKEEIENDCVTPIIRLLEKEYDTSIKSVAYVY